MFEKCDKHFPTSILSQSTPTSRRQSVALPADATYPGAPDASDLEDGPVQWTLAAPRLSPMEFARTLLIQSAVSRRQGVPADTDLSKLWFWTPRWETFLVLPRKPTAPTRVSMLSLALHGSSQDTQTQDEIALESSTLGAAPVGNNRRSFLSCPRLSLNLGNITIQLPSMLNLAALDGLQALRSSSSSSKADPLLITDKHSDTADVYTEGKATATSIPSESRIDGSHDKSPASRYSIGDPKFYSQYTSRDFELSTPPLRVAKSHSELRRHPTALSTPIYHKAAKLVENPFQDSDDHKKFPAIDSNQIDFPYNELDARVVPPLSAGSRSANTIPVSPRNIGCKTPGSAIAKRLARRAVGGQIVTPVGARKVGMLVAGEGSVMSMHAQSEDFALPDFSDEERALRPPPLQVRRQRSRGKGKGLRERDTTRRNLFSSNDGDDDVNGLLRHLGDDGAVSSDAIEDDEQPSPWSSLYGSGHNIVPATPTMRRRSSVPSSSALTPSALRIVTSPLLTRRAKHDEEQSGFSPRQRKTASVYQPLPDSPTLPTVGPQVKLKRASRCLSHDSLVGTPLGSLMRFALPPKPTPPAQPASPDSNTTKSKKSSSFTFTPKRLRKPKSTTDHPRNDSSFALHKAASHDAFTLLPKLGISRRRSRAANQPREHDSHSCDTFPRMPVIPNTSSTASSRGGSSLGPQQSNCTSLTGLDAALLGHASGAAAHLHQHRPPLPSSWQPPEQRAELDRRGHGADAGSSLRDYLKLDSHGGERDKSSYSHLAQPRRDMQAAPGPPGGQGQDTGTVVEGGRSDAAARGRGGGCHPRQAAAQQRIMQDSCGAAVQGGAQDRHDGLDSREHGPEGPAIRDAAHDQQHQGKWYPSWRQPAARPGPARSPPSQLTALGVTSRPDDGPTPLARGEEYGMAAGVLGILRGSEVQSRNKIRKSGRHGGV